DDGLYVAGESLPGRVELLTGDLAGDLRYLRQRGHGVDQLVHLRRGERRHRRDRLDSSGEGGRDGGQCIVVRHLVELLTVQVHVPVIVSGNAPETDADERGKQTGADAADGQRPLLTLGGRVRSRRG